MGCGLAPPSGVTEIATAQLAVGARTDPPPDADPAWHAVGLPDVWYMARRAEATEGWYRMHFDHPGGSPAPWAILLSWSDIDAAVRVDGARLSDGITFDGGTGLHLNAPLLVVVPAVLLREGRNVVDIHLRVARAAAGGLGTLLVGPASALESTYAWRRFLQGTFLVVVALAALLLGALNGAIYWRRDPGGARRWLALATALWSIPIFTGLVRGPPIPLRLWDWLGAAALAAVAWCFMKGFHAAAGLERRRLERIVLGGQAALALAALLVPELWAFATIVLWIIATAGLGTYVVWLVVGAIRRRKVEYPVLLTIAAGVASVLIAHDVASVFARRPLTGLWLAVYAVSAVVLLTGVTNMLDFARAMGEAERLNRELEQRVRDKHAELERNYAALRVLESARAVAEERERIMRDMHDGMGGQLVSTLAMVESGRSSSGAVADALRDVLDDLRLVIDSLDPVEGDLGAALGQVRHRLEPRLERNGIRFDWRVLDLPAVSDLGPERVLQVLRIVQEAIANVVKHATASTVTLTTGADAMDGRSGVYVEVRDDGCGFDLAAANGRGRGLANMRRRASDLGGSVTVSSDGAGAAVRLWLPLAPITSVTRPA